MAFQEQLVTMLFTGIYKLTDRQAIWLGSGSPIRAGLLLLLLL